MDAQGGSELVGRVVELRRYPVKSLAGEQLAAADIDHRGIVDDRRWAVVDATDGRLGSGKTSRRFRRLDGLLDVAASLDGCGPPRLTFPDGRTLAADDPAAGSAMTALVGRPVLLAPEGDTSHFDEGPLHLVTTAALTALGDVVRRPVATARLRSNLLVETAGRGVVEEDWIGHELHVGGAVLRVREAMVRCVMVEHPQGDLPAMPGLLGAIGAYNDASLGVVADVVSPGRVALGDEVRLAEG